ncbi:FtsW/RodA/SpoVE family cell cycle protein [Mesobacillus zeae]|uniref:Probable peptidoglycan glycosyltransferase FtsW n=1 Tax=Mesobacillus zeae TaxID=1917180 RepID=A0A398BCP8_9BACI|nr:FtsW/RodA/SpoVE family cell cycle protein [Mesobacillus zeae]RID87865.1 FtsW/RodA/SpoVE family cell cycle protein [Mesobacillus zeae]
MLKKILRSYDYSLIIVMVLLSLFGLIMIYSASMVTAVQRYDYPSDFFYQKQKLHILVAGFVFCIAAIFPYKAMKSTKFLLPMVIIIIGGLLALFLFGKVAGNALSWIEVGTRSIQPSEFAKLSVIIYLSAIFAKRQAHINEFDKGLTPPLVYLGLICLLVAIQPDFGTAIIIGAIGGTIFLSSGVNRKILLLLFCGLLVVLLMVSIVFKDEIYSETRQDRFTSYSDPFADEKDSGYHLANSYYAIGSGGIKGLGLGQSVQKLGYLPEPHTDFIISVISEELGIFGVGFVLLSLSYIVLKGIYIGLKCRDPFGSLLAIGISSMIGIQSFINLGGASGVIPLTGVPLPFVSYGGSSLLQLSLAMGILVNVSMFVNFEEKYKDKIQQQQRKPSKQVSFQSGRGL